MASRASYEIAVIIIVFLIFFPVSALPQNDTSLNSEPITTRSQTLPYTIKLFIPTSNEVHSDQIMDQINFPNGDVLFATAFGLSTFNGTWSTRHTNMNNISAGLMDDFITAIEFDQKGNLWLGYSGGIQIYNGDSYLVIRDQQLLKETRIHDLQRWNNDMWIATGHAGIHRYRDGEWTWFQPMTKNGPGFYEIDSMALDSVSNSLVIATLNEGLWIVRKQDDPVEFEMLATKDDAAGMMQHVKRDPLGGVYFFNPEKIIHYDTVSGFRDILTTADLTQEQITINDIAAGSDGNLNIATDDGLYIWREGAIYRHLNRFEGMGTSENVRSVNMDQRNRVWFATPGNVGYYMDNTNPEKLILIDPVTPTPSLIPVITIPINNPINNPINPNLSATTAVNSSSGSSTIFSWITDPIARAISAIAQKFGVNILS
ncbi:MAG: two-component regulator propeller domain-containing protein [Methanomicrobiales archaeon]